MVDSDAEPKKSWIIAERRAECFPAITLVSPSKRRGFGNKAEYVNCIKSNYNYINILNISEK